MINSKLLTMCAAIAVTAGGFAVTGTRAFGQPPIRPVVIEAPKADPTTQRSVGYADLNLAFAGDQRILSARIYRTADSLCWDLNGINGLSSCTDDAVHSTDDQVAAAILRAQLKLAGVPVGPALAISMGIGAK